MRRLPTTVLSLLWLSCSIAVVSCHDPDAPGTNCATNKSVAALFEVLCAAETAPRVGADDAGKTLIQAAKHRLEYLKRLDQEGIERPNFARLTDTVSYDRRRGVFFRESSGGVSWEHWVISSEIEGREELFLVTIRLEASFREWANIVTAAAVFHVETDPCANNGSTEMVASSELALPGMNISVHDAFKVTSDAETLRVSHPRSGVSWSRRR